MIRNIVRILLLLIYPIIVLTTFLLIYRKKKYQETVRNNYKTIILNALIIEIVFYIFLFAFLSYEKTVYTWDYSGYWVKSLTLRELFINNPFEVLNGVFRSFNYSEYSDLFALFSLPFTIINQSYWFYAIGNFTCFILPVFILLEILYYTYFNRNKYLPLLTFIIFFPLYLPILDGKPFAGGMFFILAAFMLVIFQDFESIDYIDTISINFLTYLSVFERRWYVYSVIGLYVSFLIKYLFAYKKLNNKIKPIFTKLIPSGLILFILLLTINYPFVQNILNSDYKTAYTSAAHTGKIFDYIDRYSILIIAICCFGLYKMIKQNLEFSLINIIYIILTTAMFWYVQAFEDHHFYIAMLNMIFLFGYGFYHLFNIKFLNIILSVVLVTQSCLIYVNYPNIPLFTSKKRLIKRIDYVGVYSDFCNYLLSIMNENDTVFLCGSSSILNDDIIRSSILPNIHAPNFEYAQYDMAGGFPNDLDKAKFMLITDPVQYINPSLQRIYKVISDAINNNDEFKDTYAFIDDYYIDSFVVHIYKREKEYTDSMRRFLYDEIIKYYPNNKEIFEDILN